MKVRKHCIFHGRVQGVGFRFTIEQFARQMNLTGWVRNQYDGTVEACIQGEQQQINQLIDALKHERFIRVDSIDEENLSLLDNEKSFGIRF